MTRYYLLWIISLFFSQWAFAQTEISSKSGAVYFATASANLSEDAQVELRELCKNIFAQGDYQLTLRAHTDSRGNTDYNQGLAQARARAVTNYLLDLGVQVDGNFESLILGEAEAGDDSHDKARQRNNRRVDFNLYHRQWEALGELKKSLQAPIQQQLKIAPSNNQWVEGEAGGRFFLPANSLVFPSGDLPKGEVDIQLIECYSFGDMISMGLHTSSEGQILQSGGMFSLTATSQGQALILREGEEIEVSVPSSATSEGMSVFYGIVTESNQMDWQNSESPVSTERPKLDLASPPGEPSYSKYLARHLMVPSDELSEKADLVDANGWYTYGSEAYFSQKAKADEEYAIVHKRYTRDITRYEVNLEKTVSVNIDITQQYLLRINRLGWANIDRFLKEDLVTTQLLAQEPTTSTNSETAVFILFPELNVILPMQKNATNGHLLNRMPIGENATILAIKVEDKKIFIAQENIVITDDMVLTLHYEPSRLKDIREALASL